MATERQIESNRRNALRSTGPRTAEGKVRSRANALKHGLAAETELVVPAMASRAEARSALWVEEIRPATPVAGFALDCAVAASVRIEQCQEAFDAHAADHVARAALAWDVDRRAEAAALFVRLAKCPPLVAAQLATTTQGADLIRASWDRLGSSLDASGDWTEAEASVALDLLGVPADQRGGRTVLDAPDGVDPTGHRLDLARREVERLTALQHEALDDLDAFRRRQAEAGATSLLTRTSALIFRYERDAWRRYHASMKVARAGRDDDPAALQVADVSPPLDRTEEAPADPPPDLPAPTPPTRLQILRARLAAATSREEFDEVEAEMEADLQQFIADRHPSPVAAPVMPTVAPTQPHLNRQQRRAAASRSRRA